MDLLGLKLFSGVLTFMFFSIIVLATWYINKWQKDKKDINI